jgi:hypothetical protein
MAGSYTLTLLMTLLAQSVGVRTAPPPPPSLPHLAVMADAGVPDGLIASLVVRPARWLRFAGGGGSNGTAPAVRGGMTLLPLGAGPSLTLEIGRAWPGDLNRLVSLMGGPGDGQLLRHVGYTYGNAHLGLDLGRGRVVFFLHAGVSFIRARLGDSAAYIEDRARVGASGGDTTVAVRHDATVSGTALSGKLGLVLYVD